MAFLVGMGDEEPLRYRILPVNRFMNIGEAEVAEPACICCLSCTAGGTAAANMSTLSTLHPCCYILSCIMLHALQTEIYEERIKQQRDVDPVLLHAGYLNGDMKVNGCTCCKDCCLVHGHPV
jgi:hypothetical protein